MALHEEQGFGPVLASRAFRALWIAQLLAQTAQNGIHFVQMVLIERLTGSSVHLGLVILSFSLPGIVFSPVAGVVVDRLSKKQILVASNIVRVLAVFSYLLLLATLQGGALLLAIYLLTFLTSTIGQFFSPAQAATIPLLVGEERLVTANSLFNLTLAISQVVGLIIFGPLVVKIVGVQGGFVSIALMYLAATVLVSRIPRDEKPRRPAVDLGSVWVHLGHEVRGGWLFVVTNRRVYLAIGHLALVASLIMILAMLVPGFAARVMGLAPEDSVVVFAPAGVGMLVATGLLGRLGYRLNRDVASHLALGLAGFAFALLAWISRGYSTLRIPILEVHPQAFLSLTGAVMAISFLLGFSLSTVNILAQTALQIHSPPNVRGRVFAVQFMLNNLVGIPPMLAIGYLADRFGIPSILRVLSWFVLGLTFLSAYAQFRPISERERQRQQRIQADLEDASSHAQGP